jgi:two-component system sensor histidine kinase BaeS
LKFWRPGITGKLFIAILATCIVLLISMHWAVRISFERGFIDYIKRGNEQRLTMLGDALSEQYAQHGSWTFLRNNDRFIFQLLKTFERDNDDRSPPGRGNGPPHGGGRPEMPPDAAPDRPPTVHAAIVAAVPAPICPHGWRTMFWVVDQKGAYWWARASACRRTGPGAVLWSTALRLARSSPRRLNA